MNIPSKNYYEELNTLFFGKADEPEKLQQKINSLVSPIIYICDANKKKLGFINTGITEILGYECDEITSWDDYFTLLVFDGDKDAVRKEMKRFYSLKGGEAHTYSCRLTDKYGCQRQFSTRGCVLGWKDSGAPESFLFTAIDITEDLTHQKEYEHELEKHLGELERSNKDLEEFAYIASHDLQEPLRKITAFGQRIAADDKISNESRADLARVINAAENMRTLINNLLEYSRLTHNILAFETTDLGLLLNEVKAELETEIADAGAIIVADKLPCIDVMPQQIKQLFSNIILNAIKFRKPGQVTEIKITSSLITDGERYGLQNNNTWFKISFTDNGIGFKQEYAEKIFKMFQRLHGRAEYPGTGVGLAICKRIADNHNGRIFATSSPGEGATFTLLLPAKNNN